MKCSLKNIIDLGRGAIVESVGGEGKSDRTAY